MLLESSVVFLRTHLDGKLAQAWDGHCRSSTRYVAGLSYTVNAMLIGMMFMESKEGGVGIRWIGRGCVGWEESTVVLWSSCKDRAPAAGLFRAHLP